MTEKTRDASTLKGVVIGGGSGSPVSIKTLLALGLQVTSVVAMADDGGSTGILREEADVTPPGDIRKCLVAMAEDPNEPLTKAFRLRFEFGERHPLGNLMLVALEQTTGSFPEAIALCGKLMGARGPVYPSTLTHVRLHGEDITGQVREGQVNCCYAPSAIKRCWLTAEGPVVPYEPALQAIREADVIMLGPGSLFTSIIPNLLVPGVAQAVRESSACVIFPCSVADVQGETRGLTVADHVRALCSHGLDGRIDHVLVNQLEGSHPLVRFSEDDRACLRQWGCQVHQADFADLKEPAYHDLGSLTQAVGEVLGLCPSPRR